MATYVMLCNYTDKGIENIKDSPSRLEAAKKAFQAMGGELKQFYLSMGQYDMIVIGEIPNDKAAATLALAIGAKGAVRSETLRAFTEDEYKSIVDALP